MKTFSDGIQGSVSEYADNLDFFAPEDVTIGYIRHGRTRKEKTELYFQHAGVTKSKHKNFIKNEIKKKWVDWQFLDPGGFQGDYYNKNFLNFLQKADKEFGFTGIKDVGTHMPTEKVAAMKKEIEDLIKKKVPGITKRDKERIWNTGGHVPPWWDPVPATKSLTYYIKKAIEGQRASAADVEKAIKRAATGNITEADKRMIRGSWPYYEAEKIIKGKREFPEKSMRVIKTFGEYYHRDVGWY